MLSYNGIVARIRVVFHKTFHPSHNVLWRTNIDEICTGDIVCKTCGVVYWCRAHDLSFEQLERLILLHESVDPDPELVELADELTKDVEV